MSIASAEVKPTWQDMMGSFQNLKDPFTRPGIKNTVSLKYGDYDVVVNWGNSGWASFSRRNPDIGFNTLSVVTFSLDLDDKPVDVLSLVTNTQEGRYHLSEEQISFYEHSELSGLYPRITEKWVPVIGDRNGNGLLRYLKVDTSPDSSVAMSVGNGIVRRRTGLEVQVEDVKNNTTKQFPQPEARRRLLRVVGDEPYPVHNPPQFPPNVDHIPEFRGLTIPWLIDYGEKEKEIIKASQFKEFVDAVNATKNS